MPPPPPIVYAFGKLEFLFMWHVSKVRKLILKLWGVGSVCGGASKISKRGGNIQITAKY